MKVFLWSVYRWYFWLPGPVSSEEPLVAVRSPSPVCLPEGDRPPRSSCRRSWKVRREPEVSPFHIFLIERRLAVVKFVILLRRGRRTVLFSLNLIYVALCKSILHFSFLS